MMLPEQPDIDTLRAVERAFGITADAPTNLGALDGRIQHTSLLVEMLQALRALPGVSNRLSPSAPLSTLAPGGRPTVAHLRDLGDRADLDLLPAAPRSLGTTALRIGAGVGLAALAIGLSLGTGEWGGMLLLVALPSVLLLSRPVRRAKDTDTVADLLRAALPHNIARLRAPQLPEDDAARAAHLGRLCAAITTSSGPTCPPNPPNTPSEAMPWQT